MKNILVVESPAKCQTIEKYLGKDYRVLASYGHVRDLPSKNGSVRPEEDFAITYEVNNDSQKHISEIAKYIKKAERLYLATDPDREGEAISWHVLEALKEQGALRSDLEIHRIVFNEITKKAVTAALSKPRTIDVDLVDAQQARRALDYLVGFSLSPILWRKLPGSRSAGRVQSVALRLICDREEEIEQFKPQEYWSVTADFRNSKRQKILAKLSHFAGDKLEKFSITNQKQAEDILSKLEEYDYKVANITKKQVRRNPQAPFTTSTLQQEAARKLGFGAKRTMMIAQKLYEGIKIDGETSGLITYMRTDAVVVSADAIAQTRQVIGREFGADYVPAQERAYKSKGKNVQEAHEAIRPTDISRTPEVMKQYLDKDQLKLYTLIWKRMVASQMESAVLDQTTVEIAGAEPNIIAANDNLQELYSLKKAIFRATGSVIKFDGFLRLYQEGNDDAVDGGAGSDDDKILPPVKEGAELKAKEIMPNQHFTEPPPRFSEASLVKKLEELGIGRPSTYASIISVLQDRKYVILDKKRFIPEGRGRLVNAFLKEFFADYVRSDFTAKIEEELDDVADGDLPWKELMQRFWQAFNEHVQQAQELPPESITEKLDRYFAPFIFADQDGNLPKLTGDPKTDPRACPKCKVGILHVKSSKYGAFLGCDQYPDCDYTRPVFSAEQDDAASGDAEGAIAGKEPKLLGEHSDDGSNVYLKKGPYGWYVQKGEDKEKKKKRSTLPKGYQPEDLDLQLAEKLLTLPCEVGNHPESNDIIKAGFGRYGPYLHYQNKYYSLKEDDPLEIGLNRAVVVIAEHIDKKAKKEQAKSGGEQKASNKKTTAATKKKAKKS